MVDLGKKYEAFVKTLEEMDIKPSGDTKEDIEIWMQTYLQEKGKTPTVKAFQQPPRINTFQGNDRTIKGDNTRYELWRHEIRCLMNEKVHSEQAIVQALRRSVKGEAGMVVMRLGEKAGLDEILYKMDSIYGQIDEKESIMLEFYQAKQKDDEDVSTWSCRLEDILSRAILTGKVKASEADSMLHDMLFKGLRPELKDKAHYEKERYTSFDELRVVLRKLEHDHLVEHQPPTKVSKQTCKSTSEKKDEDDELDVKAMLKQMNSRLEKVESGAQGKQPNFRNNYRGNYRGGYRGNYRGSRGLSGYYRGYNRGYSRGQGRGRGYFTPTSDTQQSKETTASNEPLICRRCKMPNHYAKHCLATHDKDGKPLN